MNDSLDFATVDDSVCVDVYNREIGIWYQIEGDGNYVALNFPNIDYSNVSNVVRISLFEGDCGAIICRNDLLQTYNRKKVFLTEEGKQYYLLMHNVEASINDRFYNRIIFNVSCYNREVSNLIENALPIECDFVFKGFAFNADYTVFEGCHAGTEKDIWLSIEGNDEYIYINDNSGYFASDGDRLVGRGVYLLNNDLLECVGSIGERIFLPKGTTYYLRMGINESASINANYDFDVTFTCFQELQPCPNPKDCEPDNRLSPLLEKTSVSNFINYYTSRLHNIDLKIQPNPFRNNTQLHYQLIEEELVEIKISTIQGQIISIVQDQTLQSAGQYTYEIQADDLISGIYFLQFSTSKGRKVLKLLIQK